MSNITLSWNDRLAIIDHFKPSDCEIKSVMGVTQGELNTARVMRQQGTLMPSRDIDVRSYGSMFNTQPTKSISNNNRPLTATKHTRTPQKRGRKGTKINDAFAGIPQTPVDLDVYSSESGVSIPVLRQSKRFDTTGISGRVKVKKNTETNTLQIWREVSS